MNILPSQSESARPSALRKQHGATLIEVLIAVLILGLGLLGMAALQTRALQGSQSATQRSQAVMSVQEMLDILRVDRVAANSGVYNTPSNGAQAICIPTTYSSNSLPDTARRDWLQAMQNSMSNGNDSDICGAIFCNGFFVCTVRIEWDDSKAGGLPGKQVIAMTSQI
jgi:type IV pilus assembly protein PilV